VKGPIGDSRTTNSCDIDLDCTAGRSRRGQSQQQGDKGYWQDQKATVAFESDFPQVPHAKLLVLVRWRFELVRVYFVQVGRIIKATLKVAG
jgi:hypothetical protein